MHPLFINYNLDRFLTDLTSMIVNSGKVTVIIDHHVDDVLVVEMERIINNHMVNTIGNTWYRIGCLVVPVASYPTEVKTLIDAVPSGILILDSDTFSNIMSSEMPHQYISMSKIIVHRNGMCTSYKEKKYA